ncbi:MAG TPA: tRNA threonylcarbamoyladenosine dehydratase, partial [Hyalangium sp.]|nr:tRNA threonylcarbamoyladenosine dehydratase [Hyalangium sp.]
MDTQQPTASDTSPAPGVSPLAKPFKLSRRFDRTGRLLGDTAMERLAAARVIVFGLGGV